jgi:F420-dependent oxidoreductase-like protein
MRFGIDVSHHQLTWEELTARVRFAEEAGFDGAWVFDHFKPLYGDPDGPCMEVWTLLAALAATTTRIRLGALVTGLTYRHPSVLAAEAATVDVISGGRLEFSLGAAWYQPEHDALGIPFPPFRARAEGLEDALRICKLLWTIDDASYDGKHFSIAKATYRPRPVQTPHPPVWVGAGGERVMLPIVARHADVWHGFGAPDEMARKSRLLDRLAEEAGRDPSSIARSTSLSLSRTADEIRARIDAYREAGFSYLVVSWPSEGKAKLEEFVETIMPAAR